MKRMLNRHPLLFVLYKYNLLLLNIYLLANNIRAYIEVSWAINDTTIVQGFTLPLNIYMNRKQELVLRS